MGENTLTKYNTKAEYGEVDNVRTLEAADDIAFIKTGGKGRMPTAKELEDILATKDNANYVWEKKNIGGTYGYEIKYKVNGNSIFLPFAGFINFSHPYLWYRNQYGYYWSASICEDAPLEAISLAYTSTLQFDNYSRSRLLGLSVRPVCNK